MPLQSNLILGTEKAKSNIRSEQ